MKVEVATLQQRANEGEAFQFGPFRLAVSERLLMNGDVQVSLGSRALDVLIALVERAGEVVSHRELIKRVWPDVIVEEASLRVSVAGIRRALGDGRDGARYITNVPGRGYCFVAPVQRLVQGGQSTATPVGRGRIQTLPARLQRMIGRDETVEALRLELMSRRFVSIVGPGGVGKTTVAVAVAHGLADEFRDAVCFVDLSALQERALVVPAVASAVGCLAHTQDSLSRLLAFLADKRLLLVLDSCEHVIEAVAILAEGVFRQAPLIHIIATSRESLRVEGENVHPLRSLDSPTSGTALTAAKALASPAVRLFMDRAAAGGYRDELTDEDAPIVADICRQLDGMPLAIELTASRASTYGIGGLAELIGDRLMLLWQGRRSVPRHQTLQAMLDWSYDLLSDREKAILCALSVFVGAFTMEMAQAVVAEADRDELQFATIASLVDKSLISVSLTGGASWYRLLDTTRAYAAVRLKELGAANATARRHALYYAERLAGLRGSTLRDRDLTPYSRQIGDIRAALEWSFSPSGDRSVGVALGAGAVPLFLGMSMLSECRWWCLQTIDALSEEDRGTKLELRLQLPLATSSIHAHSDSVEVGTALERGLSLADSMGDADYQLEFLAGLNLYRARLADSGGSLAVAQRYAAIARELGRPREVVMAEWMLGASYHLVGEQAAAQQSYKRGFEHAAAAGVSELHSFGYDHQVRAFVGYARTLWDCGLPDQAAQFAYRAIEVAERKEHPISLCICLVFVAPVFLWRGDRQIAEELVERLITYAGRYSLAMYRAGGLGLRGALMLERGDTEPGIKTLREALSTLRTEQRNILLPSNSRALAEGLARTGNSAEATSIIDAAVANALRGSGTFELPDLLRARATVLLAASPANWPAAEASLKDSLDCARQQHALGWELRSAMALARLWMEHGRVDEARSLLGDVYGQFTEGFETADLKEAERQLRVVGARMSYP
ncbi:winged helix-turn-helix domain-containing protein [Bradyrhizobium sp. Arg237L]|uniref:ATP-binding protein n=1 Tax=Bradyrhizobium sp. Arg237L TaxID=3003352 RepID=UPI00249EBE60|nr:winged helix-turn-helix domain-containing protein [Bradyrhizobium sp. Arg237L]MDI4237376.1 winged helix-turn-helix domain-containing protein [Bradyrhizobium sp. Arg237L]